MCGLLARPGPVALVVPLVVLLYFGLVSRPIWKGPHGFQQAGAGALFQGIRGAKRDWIDTALPPGARVAALWTGHTDRFTINQNEFFNRALGPVYYTGAPTPGGLAETPSADPAGRRCRRDNRTGRR